MFIRDSPTESLGSAAEWSSGLHEAVSVLGARGVEVLISDHEMMARRLEFASGVAGDDRRDHNPARGLAQRGGEPDRSILVIGRAVKALRGVGEEQREHSLGLLLALVSHGRKPEIESSKPRISIPDGEAKVAKRLHGVARVKEGEEGCVGEPVSLPALECVYPTANLERTPRHRLAMLGHTIPTYRCRKLADDKSGDDPVPN